MDLIVLTSSFGFPCPHECHHRNPVLKPKMQRHSSWLLSPLLLASSPLVSVELPLWTAPRVSAALDFPLHMCPLQIPLINAERQKQCQCPSADEWMDAVCQIHTIEYYSSLKRERNTGTCFNMDGPQKTLYKWTKSEGQRSHITYSVNTKYWDKSILVVAKGRGKGGWEMTT